MIIPFDENVGLIVEMESGNSFVLSN